MQLTTPVPVPKSDFPISYDSEIFSIGSCFAENMAQKLSHFQFRNTVNPFGILFHPMALQKFFELAMAKKDFPENELFFHNERWHCFDAHSDLSHPDKSELVSNLNEAIGLSNQKMASATHFVITLGTAWAYRFVESGNLVANCHKVPQKQFRKELLPVPEIADAVSRISNIVESVNPSAKIIFTVSPVRHIKDGFAENQRSKSHLIAGLHSALEKASNAYYFPSYEIVMDELRDYRFYSRDMIHPNQTAIDFIWERFASAWISENSKPDMDEVDAIAKALSHRPFNPGSDQHKKFLASVESRISEIKKRLPFLDFS